MAKKAKDRRSAFVLYHVSTSGNRYDAAALCTVVANDYNEAARTLGGRVWVNKKALQKLGPISGLSRGTRKQFFAGPTTKKIVEKLNGLSKDEKTNRVGLAASGRVLLLQRLPCTIASGKLPAKRGWSPLDGLHVAESHVTRNKLYFVMEHDDGHGRTKKVVRSTGPIEEPVPSLEGILLSRIEDAFEFYARHAGTHNGCTVKLLGVGLHDTDWAAKHCTLTPFVANLPPDPDPFWTLSAFREHAVVGTYDMVLPSEEALPEAALKEAV